MSPRGKNGCIINCILKLWPQHNVSAVLLDTEYQGGLLQKQLWAGRCEFKAHADTNQSHFSGDDPSLKSENWCIKKSGN